MSKDKKNKGKFKKPTHHKANSHKQKPPIGLWFYGKHAVIAAINNPQREVVRILTTHSGRDILLEELDSNKLHIEIVEASVIMKHTPDGQPNQGIVAQVMPLKQKNLADIPNAKLIMMLDQVTDPHNIGAILRSCAAFGADALIVHDHNCPPETPTMAKSASGALEIMPIIRVTNLKTAMAELKNDGFWTMGMDGKSDTSIKDVKKFDKIAIIMGAEGKGLRRLTAEQCDLLVKLPIKRTVESLNVSNAAAIALYELS